MATCPVCNGSKLCPGCNGRGCQMCGTKDALAGVYRGNKVGRCPAPNCR